MLLLARLFGSSPPRGRESLETRLNNDGRTSLEGGKHGRETRGEARDLTRSASENWPLTEHRTPTSGRGGAATRLDGESRRHRPVSGPRQARRGPRSERGEGGRAEARPTRPRRRGIRPLRSSSPKRRSSGNDPSAGSPTETLLRLLLPLNAQVRKSSRARGRREPAGARSECLTKTFNR